MQRSDVTHCAWCAAELTEGEVFQHELRHVGWSEGGLLVPEEPDAGTHQPPLPRCSACNQSLKDNLAAMQDEEAACRTMPEKWFLVAFASFSGVALLAAAVEVLS